MMRLALCASLVAMLHFAAAAEVAEKHVPLPAGAAAHSSGPGGQHRIAISPDGKQIAAGTKAGQIRIYDFSSLKLVNSFAAHEGACGDVKFAPSGRLFSSGADMLVKEWDVAGGKELRQFKGHEGDVHSLACSPDGLLLASGDAAATIRIWDLKSGRQLHAMTGHQVDPERIAAEAPVCTIDALVFSPDSRLVLSEADDETARLWDPLAGRQVRVLPNHDGAVASLAFSPDGVYGVSTRGMQMCPYGPALRLWEVYTGETCRIFSGHTHDITCVAFSPDGRYVVTGAHDRTIRQWEVDTALELRRFTLVTPPVGLAYAPDGRTVVSVSDEEGVVVWDLTKSPLYGDAELTADTAWQKLNEKDYFSRAGAMQHYVKLPPADAVNELAKRRREPVPADRTAKELIEKLDDDRYGVRTKAFEDLRQLGPAAREAVADALEHPSLEVRVRATQLLRELGGPLDVRPIVVIEILGLIGTKEAREELHSIVSESTLPYTNHAKAVLARTIEPK